MAETFSCTLAFRSSYLRKVARNASEALPMTTTRNAPRITSAPRKIRLIFGLITMHITNAMIIISGARTAMRIIIINAFCRFVTSVVIRVTSPAVEYLSILEKENVWIFAYMESRRFAAKPVEASEANTPPRIPNKRLANAMISMISP